MSTMSGASARLAALRGLMSQNECDAFVVHSDDPHMSEYVADCWRRRAFISGFTGSAGTAVITHTQALLWTDGRYYLQAEKELEASFWTLMKMQEPGVPDIPTWLDKNLKHGAVIGVDSSTMSISFALLLAQQLQGSGKYLKSPQPNLVDLVWGKEQPPYPNSKVQVHDIKYAGESAESKLNRLRLALQQEGCKMTVLTALDQIAWILNIRGWDVTCNPVVVSYLVVRQTDAFLYVDYTKIEPGVSAYLTPLVKIRPYEQLIEDIAELALSAGEGVVMLEPSSCNYAVYLSLSKETVKLEMSPVTKMKAIKNETELDGFRRCHIRDAAALVSYLSWLEGELNNPDAEPITEFTGATKLEGFRKATQHFVGLSFESISSSGSNGAIVHYSPSEKSAKLITKDEVYLIDSGGQYLDGTTDVTRTLHFGVPTEYEKKCFTHVLKGHIALDRVIFPPNENGVRLDILARTPLWSIGLDYEHGTGHGVGAFLNVHEGPHYVGKRNRDPKQPSYPLLHGMTVTNEPGYYETGKFGIRIENVLLVRPADEVRSGWSKFEHVTLVPIQKKMIDASYLTEEEIAWVNKYHAECFEKISPLLSGSALEYLTRETSPLTRQ